MKIGSFVNGFQINNKNNSQVNNNASYPNLAPLKKDTVSFGASINETEKSEKITKDEIKRIVTQSGDRRVDDANIEALSQIVDKDKMPLLKKLAGAKTTSGNLRYSDSNIVKLMSVINKDNESLYDELAGLKDSDGITSRLSGYNIFVLMSLINEDNKPLFEKLEGMKDDKGVCLITGHEVARIFPEVNKDNIQRCENLLRNGHPVCDELIYNLRNGRGSCWPF